jgi:hypothetical protein
MQLFTPTHVAKWHLPQEGLLLQRLLLLQSKIFWASRVRLGRMANQQDLPLLLNLLQLQSLILSFWVFSTPKQTSRMHRDNRLLR